MTHAETTGGGPPLTAVDRPSPGPSSPAGSPPRVSHTALKGDVHPRFGKIRLPTLTGLRFIATLLVFINHAGLPFPNRRLLEDDDTAMDFFEIIRNVGGPTITFFFVLSGFIMTWSARESDTAGTFWRRRAFKIFPNYVVAWVLAWTLYASAYTPVGTGVANLFMVHAWSPEWDHFNSVNPPHWSMCAELLFYALFPLMYAVLRKINPDHLKYWISGVIAAILTIPVIADFVLSDTPYFPGGAELDAKVTATQYWFVYYSPPLRIFDFALGVLIALAIKHGRWWNVGMIWSGLGVIGAIVGCYYVPFLYGQRALGTIPVAFFVAAAAIADMEGRFTLFRHQALVWLGEISFAFYLVHDVVITYGRKAIGDGYYSGTGTAFILTAMFALSLGLAALMYFLIERPIMRAFATSKKRRAKPAAAAAASAA